MGADTLPDGGTRLNHGCYAVDSRFDIEQHGYAGAENGYIELLEVKDAPDSKPRVYIVWHSSGDGYRLYTFQDMEQVRKVWPEDRPWPVFDRLDADCQYAEIPPARAPWFYAGPEEEIDGDFVAASISEIVES